MRYRFEVYRDRRGEWRWRFRAPNHRTLADSGEGYTNKTDCNMAILTIKREAATAPIQEE